MMIKTRVRIALNERAILHVRQRPVRYLAPGVHTVWDWTGNRSVETFDTDRLVVSLRPEQLELVPAEDLHVLIVGEDERVLVRHRGRPARWLQPGAQAVWTVDRMGRGEAVEPAVTFETIDVSAVATEPLRGDVFLLVPSGEYAEVTVPHGSVALRYIDGAFDAVLPPGRHAAWSVVRQVYFSVIDLRASELKITGQEVMTKDRVSLRLNLSATYKVGDVERLATVAREPNDLLYLAVQMAVREVVATHSLDELLAARDELGQQLAPRVAERAEEVGLQLIELGIKDLVLPGDMKALLNRVIEARKQAEANVILRREETAATRSMAQTAKVLAEHPLVMRLKELEAYKDLASSVGRVNLFVGADKLRLGIEED